MNFSEGASITKAKSQGLNEIGVSGDSMIGFEQTEARTETISIDDYNKMRQKDGTVASLYNILTLPIVGASWDITADEGDANEEQADLVRKNLTNPPHKGGMQVPLTLVIADMLRGVIEGFRIFEKVYEIQDGKVVYRKLASRDSRTITLQRSDDGGYGGAVQRAAFKGDIIDVELPAWKTFLFTYGKDKNFLYGESAFKPAYYHWDKIRRFYYLAELSAQARAIPPITAQPGEQSDESPDKKGLLMRALTRFGRVSPVLYLPKGYTVAPLDLGTGQMDLLPHISHHKTEMARSVLAQFLMLGTSGTKSVGSWALSESHEDVFVTAIKGVMQNIEDHINYYLIPDLVDLNFSKPLYPEFHFEDLTSDAKTTMQAAFTELIKAGSVSEAVAKGIEDEVAKSLDIDLEAIQKDLDKQHAKDAAEAAKNGLPDPNAPAPAPADPKAPQPAPAKGDGPSPKALSDQQWARPLTAAERRVNFAQLDARYKTLEADFTEAAQPIFDRIKSDAILRLTKLLEAGDYSAVQSFSLRFLPEYRSVMATTMRDGYEYAKKATADELKVGAPATSRAVGAFINQTTQAVISKQESDLLFAVKSEVLSAQRKNQLSETQLSIGDVLSRISSAFQSFYDSKVALTGGLLVAQAIAAARGDLFDTNRTHIAAYQYSALLDAATCPICADLDGTVVDYADYYSTQWKPPIHFNCRCIWVAILDTQTEIPDTTGFPDAPGGVTAPSL